MDQSVLKYLTEELEIAIERHRAAKKNFWACVASPRLPGAVDRSYQPSESERLRDVTLGQNLARKAHMDAVIRLNLFLLHGIVPEDVKIALKGRASSVR